MPDLRLQQLMLEFASKVTLLDPPVQLDVYDMVKLQAGKLDLALIVMPEHKPALAEPDAAYTLDEFLTDAHRASAVATSAASVEKLSAEKLVARPTSGLPASAFLSKIDWSILDVVRKEPGLKMSGIARRLGMSTTSSHVRSRLAYLAAMQILTSSSRAGYSLGPKAPADKPTENPARLA